MAKVNGVSIAAIVTGGVSFFLCWIPLVGLILSVAAITLGIIGVSRSKKKKDSTGIALAVIGLVMGILTFLIGIVMILLTMEFLARMAM